MSCLVVVDQSVVQHRSRDRESVGRSCAPSRPRQLTLLLPLCHHRRRAYCTADGRLRPTLRRGLRCRSPFRSAPCSSDDIYTSYEGQMRRPDQEVVAAGKEGSTPSHQNQAPIRPCVTGCIGAHAPSIVCGWSGPGLGLPSCPRV